MKILIVMGGFFPGQKYGGPPVSVNNFCSLFREDECYIVTKNHDKDESVPYEGIDSGIWTKRDNCYVKYVSDESYKKSEFEKVILEIKPDVLYLQGLFQSCVLPCLELAKQYSLKVMLAPRGELCAGALKKKYKKIPYIAYLRMRKLVRNIDYQSTSQEETDAIKKYLKAKDNQIYFLTNIPSIPKKQYMRAIKKSGEGKFVFLSRIHPKKNLISAIDYMKEIQGNVVFDIYGPIEDEEYWKICKQKINELPTNVVVNYRGLVSHEKVHEIFSQYDAFLFPTFSENYGHVIAEALMVGTPVILSDQTPWNDINKFHAGWALPLSNKSGFSMAIQKIIDADNEQQNINISLVKKYVTEKMEIEIIREKYKTALNNV